MKNYTLLALFCLIAGTLTVSCKKENKGTSNEPQKISDAVLSQIKAKGFGTSNVHPYKDGYLVEGDIYLSTKSLTSATPAGSKIRVAKSEQYSTYELVSGLPRTFTVRVSGLGTAFVQGTDLAIQRYNALNLDLKFRRVTSGTADITIQGFYEGPSGGYITLGYSGFPENGNPYSEVAMNTHPDAYGSNPNVQYVGSVIQHEIGHCIGMRHTDYMDRSYSCGGDPIDEGDGGVGAVQIPGTPSGPDANSWMLACSNGGNRTFNSNDIIALRYLY
ncbi:MAG TPA: M57 family metalloprotease [Chitinophaga sp.]|uniref:M57 family metalloprotease n=1 Tax=Chitinophaga sp. TaxID=1869181 RepID=UPI002C2487E9|nr:M57 family metalloprotease [Chitinophaga sp.]HVI47063.1 M57 family metalloprotease [Chitinophaga sp.]